MYSRSLCYFKLDFNMNAMGVPYSESLLKAKHIYFLFMVHLDKKHDVDEFHLTQNRSVSTD